MINKEVYENITEEKLCFCDERPDRDILGIVDYLWDDELESYYYDYEGIPKSDHIFYSLLKVVDWLKNSTRSDIPYPEPCSKRDNRDYYTWLLQENRMFEEENKK
jgi:hypothetical protein